MNLFDILGPVMVGPSSSHTAGAVRIGRMARALLGQTPVKAELLLHGAFTFGTRELRDVHPNSVLITLEGEQGGKLEVGASSPGGGRIKVFRVDGLDTSFSGELPTLVVHNSDKPGCVSQVTGALAAQGLNVATLQLNRGGRGGSAVMVIECDQPVSGATAQWLRSLPGILRVNRYTPDEEEPA